MKNRSGTFTDSQPGVRLRYFPFRHVSGRMLSSYSSSLEYFHPVQRMMWSYSRVSLSVPGGLPCG